MLGKGLQLITIALLVFIPWLVKSEELLNNRTVFQLEKCAFFYFQAYIQGFDWFCMGSLHKNIQLVLDFLKALFLVLHFFY